jgi:predicted esterase
MVWRLNQETGLDVTAFQGRYEGVAFTVDDKEGREFGQIGLKPHAAEPPPARRLLAACPGAELHVVGAGHSNNPATPVEVEVRPTPRPVVLAISSDSSVIWNVKRAPGARMSAILVGGSRPQEVARGPAGVPVYYFSPDPASYFFERRKPPIHGPSFAASRFNTFEYRRMVETLNDLTGLLVSSFQGDDSGTDIVVDGTRGASCAQKERKPRPGKPKEVKPDELLAACSDADLHVIGIYSTGPGGSGLPVDVEVQPADRPIVVALSSYFPALWNLKIGARARVKAVIVCGYFEQEWEGVPPGIPVVYRASWPDRRPDSLWGYEWNSTECRNMVAKLIAMTGRPVTTFQGQSSGTSFVIDGLHGRNVARMELEADIPQEDAPAGQQAKPQEDPLGEFAEFPSQELEAQGDPKKRYFLIGPRKKAAPPSEGYGLVVIMPGGDGSADFHPFAKRIYRNALSDRYVAAQPVAAKWTPDQQIVWPTRGNAVAGMKFTTEEFVAAVIDDVAKKHKIDRSNVFSLSWSSSGPAAYALSLEAEHPVRGSFIAMSVFRPSLLPPLATARGHAYYLYHSREDRVCPYRMAEQARTSLTDNGAKVRMETYEGGHGWRGDVFREIGRGIEWLEENRAKPGAR